MSQRNTAVPGVAEGDVCAISEVLDHVAAVFPTVPPKVEYQLTPIARELVESFAMLTTWAERHRGAIADARHDDDRSESKTSQAETGIGWPRQGFSSR
jgi:HxlR-like helix-turn-helix